MKKIETLIHANIGKHQNFEEYFKIIDVIKENENTNPDICIESCKALIEGVSKTIYNKIDTSKSITELDKYTSVEKLFKDAMSKLAEKCDDDFEGDFVRQYSSMIHVIGEIRNKRGDISHGRVAPKPVYSSVKFASTVVKMTSSILEYILEHYFKLDLNPVIKLDFDAEEMEAYNSWLDDSVVFPIAKARYSKVLYENDYDEYESGYSDYLKSIEKEDEVTEGSNIKVYDEFPDAPFQGDPAESLNDYLEETQETEEEEGAFHLAWSPFDSDANVQIMDEVPDERHSEEIREVVQLVNHFDENTFWTDKRNAELIIFANTHNLKQQELSEFINKYYFTEKVPRRDEVEKVLNYRLALEDRRTELLVILEFIIEFADKLKEL